MTPTLETTSGLDVKRVDDWFANDSKRITFTVTQNGSARDISDDEITWGLYEDAYDFDTQTPVLDDTDGTVEIIRDPQFDPLNGKFQVRVEEGTLTDSWGDFWQFVVVDPPAESRQSWRGSVWIEGA